MLFMEVIMQMIPSCYPQNNVKALAAGPLPDPVVGAGRRGAGKCATSLRWGGVVDASNQERLG